MKQRTKFYFILSLICMISLSFIISGCIPKEKLSPLKPETNDNGNGWTPPAGLVIWNKLGSAAQVQNSEVGSNGNISGSVEYGTVKFGNGTKASAGDGRVYFPSTILQNNNAGCIEFWIKPLSAKTNYTKGGYYFDAYNEVTFTGFQCVIDWINYKVTFGIYHQPGPTIIIKESTPYMWNAGELVHIACVYDKNGIDATSDTVRIYINGVSANQTNASLNTLGSGPIYLNNHRLGRDDLFSTDYIDNIKIWDFAKTDFSDRNIE